MLVITVSLVLALISQIFTPMQTFLKSYMGDYVQCLLEMGELPTLGGEDTAVADEGCNARFAAATVGNGRPPINNSNTNTTPPQTNPPPPANSSSSSSSSYGGSSGTYAGSASRGGSRYFRNNRRPSSGVETGNGRAGKTIEIALEGGGSGDFFKGSNGATYVGARRKITSVAITGLTEAEKKKLEKKAEGTAKILNAGEGFAPPPKKMTVKKPEPKTVIEEEAPMTIGNFIRYLFIAAIVIALVIFIGGQALQMSKSFEK
ncbi:hypothetical protein QJS83_02635 [Bdellovibrio sp. 22V]|uniref:hypothetical protein n=1 Tax=Bdellovibrio TaxID=958 RepID=UPI002543616D|nr:hypothetical protein [Bdellovibrio sp. 22V]WII72765.1 hypothetical protein QJS83_02635 [Bdellovibrio sp. 22V]